VLTSFYLQRIADLGQAAGIDASVFLNPHASQDAIDSDQHRAQGISNLECSDLFGNPRNIAFREAVIATMDAAQVDALVYPTWSYAHRQIGDRNSPGS
jgi:hypothetical protein